MTAPKGGGLPSAGGGSLAQAAVVASAFALLLAGSNAVNPLLPAYRDLLGLDPFTLSLTYVLYVAVLVVVLFALARPRFTRHAPVLLIASLVAVIPSDLLLAHAEEWSILLGRALAGVAGGLGTGAASALVVAAIGDRGRAVTATGNSAGAVIGAAGSQLVFSLLAVAAPRAVFLGHAAVVAVLLVVAAVVLWRRREANRGALSAVPGVVAKARLGRPDVRMIVFGTVGWVGVSVAVVFGATVFAELQQPVVQVVGPTVLLVASTGVQLASTPIARLAPWASGFLAIALGVAGMLAGAWLVADWIAVAGFGVLGAGLGISYRAALVVLTRGSAPARQGALASLYAAVTYTVAASAVLLVGWVGNATGVVSAVFGLLAALAVVACAVVAWAPRLRDTVAPVD